ncbi:agamous-like MADS-box protein AGL8 [Lotus japonicus]|uniref:agamous-like MADS-box protein AGL8 n=1 Tax=Lotus japonicus TaxID=34305 RepID=UPI0025901232|nr:agamous-like MADS-box protein AGL8 [Lotus japonicus]
MGRAKVILKPIEKKNARRLTFSQRKKGLIKKVSDFHKFCGNEACLIVYDGDGTGEPEVWPPEPSKVHSILEKYEHQRSSKDRPATKTFDLENFFDNRKVMVEAEIARVKKEIFKMKYPTWDPCFNELTMEQLSFFMAKLSAKIEACDHRIDMLKKERQSEAVVTAFDNMQNMAQESAETSNHSQLNSMLNISEGQLVRASSMKSLNDNNVMVDSTYQVDATTATSFGSVQNMAQESAESSNPSQLNSMVNISHDQLVPAPMKPLNDNSVMVDPTNEVDTTEVVAFSSMQNMAQKSVESSNPCQLNSMLNNIPQGQLVSAPTKKPLSDNSGMVDSTVEVNVPLDSTDPLDDVDWVELGPMNWCNGSTNYQSDLMFRASQLDESIFQNMPF